MDKVNIKLLSPLLFSSVLVVQGCATTDDLFAEYDQNFCAASDDYNSYITHSPKAVSVSIPWEPMVYFRAGSTVLSAEGSEKIKANAMQLKENPKYKITLRSMSENEISDEFNRTLYSKRMDSVKYLLVEVLGLNASQVVVSALPEAKRSTMTDDMENVALVDIDRRIGMLLVDENSVAVSLNSTKPLAANTLTDRAWAQPSLPKLPIPVKTLPAPVLRKPVVERAPIPAAALPAPVAPQPVVTALPNPIAVPAPVNSIVTLDTARPVAGTPVPAMPVMPALPASVPAVATAVSAPTAAPSTPGMRTIVYEKWTVTEPVSVAAPSAVLRQLAAIPASVAPAMVVPSVALPVANTTQPVRLAVTNTYALERDSLVEHITRDLRRLWLARSLESILKLQKIDPAHDYAINGMGYVARLYIRLGERAVRRGDIDRAGFHLRSALRIDANIEGQQALRNLIASNDQETTVEASTAAENITAYLPPSAPRVSDFIGPMRELPAAALPESDFIGPSRAAEALPVTD